MTLTAHRVGRVAIITLICYFAVFACACWICDVFFTAAHGLAGFWLFVLAPSGEVLTPVVFIASLYAWRWAWRLAVVGFASCLLFVTWNLLPRL